MQKPTVYICIEIKNREYVSQILLALKAALRGYRVYLGTHAAVYALIKEKNEETGIYIDKSTQPLARMKWIRERTEFNCILDAELGPTLLESEVRENFSSRIYNGTEKLIDRFLVVGPAVELVAKEFFSENSSIVVMTGWPRIDLWGGEGILMYKEKVGEIKELYGDFLLYVSSFGNVRDPKITMEMNNADPINVTSLLKFETFQSQFERFNKAIQTLKIWDGDESFPMIVIRPHPSEPVSVWKKRLEGVRKTRIVMDDEIAPWILASQGVIHAGSTSAIQAHYAKKPVFMLYKLTNPVFKPVVTGISEYLITEESKYLNLDSSTMIKNPEFDSDVLVKTIYTPPSGAISSIIDVFDDLASKPIAPHRSFRVLISQINLKSLRRALGLLRDEIYWKFGKTNINSQLHFVPGGLDKERIKMVLKVDPEFNKIKYKRMTINLWEFEA